MDVEYNTGFNQNGIELQIAMDPEQQGEISYVVDRDMTICGIGGDWDRIAQENDGEGCVCAMVLGSNLKDHISDDTTRMWVEAAIRIARTSRVPVRKLYRCDTPDLRRTMEMVVTRVEDGRVEIVHRLLSTERPGPTVEITHIKRGTAQVPEIGPRKCSICNKVRIDGTWTDPFELGRDVSFTVDTGICPDCVRTQMEGRPEEEAIEQG